MRDDLDKCKIAESLIEVSGDYLCDPVGWQKDAALPKTGASQKGWAKREDEHKNAEPMFEASHSVSVGLMVMRLLIPLLSLASI